MARYTDKAVAVAIFAVAAFFVAQALGLTERVMTRKIVKACHQQKQFTVGAETFDCYLRGVVR